jgi:tetratricopeptide (TPR) repeat protein
MACGLPVIVTKGGATDDFVDEEVGWLISASQFSIGNSIDGYPLTGEAFLLQPDTTELGNVLRSIYGEPSIRFTKGILASYRARKFWTWRRSTIKALSRLDYHYGTTLAKKAEQRLEEFIDSALILGEAEKLLLKNDFNSAAEKYHNALDSGRLNNKLTFIANSRLAFISINLSNYDEASNIISEAERIAPGNPDIIYLKSLLLYNKNELTAGIETITPLLENWNSSRFDSLFGYRLDDILCLTGYMFYESGDTDGAFELFNSALSLNQFNLEACFGVALCNKVIGQTDEAKEMLEYILKLEPGYTQAKEELERIGNG